ncbi:electron transport complex subunit RsxE, partial [bacterium]|nr:electron transport complex subunit RsxE [bacterium]
GYTLALSVVGIIREVLGAGQLKLLFGDFVIINEPFNFLQQAPGAFIVLGLMLAMMNILGRLTD